MVWEKSYQKTSTALSSVITQLDGVAFTNFSDDELKVKQEYKHLYRRIWDVADEVFLEHENNAFFVMTNVIITPNQTIGHCPENNDVFGAPCDPNVPPFCPVGEPLKHGTMTGKCTLNNSTRDYTCEINAWCPLENYTKPLYAFASSSSVMTALLKGNSRRNVLDNYTEEVLRTCYFHPKEDRFCPNFKIATILQEAGINDFNDIGVSGGSVEIRINWNCDLDYDIKDCLPEYEFHRLDQPKVNSTNEPYWNFQYANFDANNDTFRTLFDVFGIKFWVNVYGEGGKLNYWKIFVTIASQFTYLTMATVVIDWIASTCCFPRMTWKDCCCCRWRLCCNYSSKFEMNKYEEIFDDHYPVWKDDGNLVEEISSLKEKIKNEAITMKDFEEEINKLISRIKGNMKRIEKVAYELCKDKWKSGVVYFEVRYCPHLLLNDELLKNPYEWEVMDGAREVIRAVQKGLNRGKMDFGVDSRSILVCIRGMKGWSSDILRLAKEFQDAGVVGIDMAERALSNVAQQIKSQNAQLKKKVNNEEASGPPDQGQQNESQNPDEIKSDSPKASSGEGLVGSNRL
ncbi:unnamed protein product [Darwinula stevensoni]|uniref:Adenosine deaminase domain-containing protein n=1 Tax=Darwinula stevensoni TaxID=69355 RepID=A0A7R9FQ63_9CRUS|nr:unnamed protein product [Darwinula stevensoni]CAG0899118.1 unnamed protein product [Darwinula stevensoni]